MSRTGPQERRLRFFKRGNTHCPICLTPFTEPDVWGGEVVTLEHAPQKSVGGKPACLTCKECNTGVSAGVDRAVADYYRAYDEGGYPVTVVESGMPRTIPGKYVVLKDEDDGGLHMTISEPGTPRAARRAQGKSVLERVRWTEPTDHAVRLGLLKSAYLMVFSLLGEAGYLYAQGEAASSIREQLLSPEEELIRPLVSFDNDLDHLPRHAVLLLTEHQCWLVKIDTSFAILPSGGSIDRYRRLAEALDAPRLTLVSTVRWPAPKFGRDSPIYGKKSDALKTTQLFGASFPNPGQDYVIVYDDSDTAAMLPVSGPPGSES